MKKLAALLLAMAMAFACAACGSAPDAETTQPTTQTIPQTEPQNTTAPAPEETMTQPEIPVSGSITYFQLSISHETGEYAALTAYDDGMGMAYLEYAGEIKKVATFELSVLDEIAAELERVGLVALNGESVAGEGSTYASMYVSYADGSYLGADYSGTVSQEFMDGYQAMDAYFQTLMADVPEYVPQPVVLGEVNADALAAMMAVLENSGMDPLDLFCITDIPTDDAYSAGLTDTAGIVNITSCGPMMMATAYSFVIATVEDESAIEAVRGNFEENLDWNRWVCVSAESALIAQKGNMVVCVMGSGELYHKTAAAIGAAGWTETETFTNPDL